MINNYIAIFYIISVFLVSCNNEGGTSSSSVLKKVWSLKLNKLEGSQGFEQPSIDGDRAYFPNGPFIECRELATGKLIWNYKIVGGGRDYHGSNFSFNSNLIVINDLFSTVALNKYTGEFVWMAPDSGTQRAYGNMNWIDEQNGYRHPFVTKPRSFIQFDLNSGNTIRTIISDSGGVQSVISNERGVFVGTLKGIYNERGDEISSFGTVCKFNPQSGILEFCLKAEPRWYDFGGYGEFLSSITNLFTVPFLDNNYGYHLFMDGTVFKFNLETGEMIWKYVLPLNEYHHDFPDAISLILDKEKNLVFVTGSKHNWYCLDAETGKQVYWKVLNSEDGVGNIEASSYDGNRYVFKPHPYNSNEWYIIDLTTGEVVEEFDIPGDSILSQDVKNGYVAAFGVLNFYVFKIVR